VIGLIFVAVGVVVLDYPLENLNVIFVYFLQTLKKCSSSKSDILGAGNCTTKNLVKNCDFVEFLGSLKSVIVIYKGNQKW